MNGPRYIEANLDEALYRQRCYQIHQERLKNIETKKESNQAKQQDQLRQKVRESKMRNHIFTYNEKNASINRENEVLMTKLIEISKGKWSSINPVKPHIPGYRPHSLNVVNRKLESERITSQNHTLAKRILEKPSAINKRILDQNYVAQRKYQSIVRKSNKMKAPVFQGRVGHLPPIKIETAKGSKGFGKGKANSSTQSDMNRTAPLMEPSLLNQIPRESQEEDGEEAKEKPQTQKSPRIGGKRKSVGIEKKKVGAYMAEVSYSPRRQESKKSTSTTAKRMKSKDNSEIQEDVQKALKQKQAAKEPESKKESVKELPEKVTKQEEKIQEKKEEVKKESVTDFPPKEEVPSAKASSSKVVTAVEVVDDTKQEPSEKKASQKEIASIKSETVVQAEQQEEKGQKESEKAKEEKPEEDSYAEDVFEDKEEQRKDEEPSKEEKSEVAHSQAPKEEDSKVEDAIQAEAASEVKEEPAEKQAAQEEAKQPIQKESEKAVSVVEDQDQKSEIKGEEAKAESETKEEVLSEGESRAVQKKETSNLISAVQGEETQGPKPSEDVEEPKEN